MTALIALPILLPLFGAALSVGLGRSRAAQRVVSVVTLGTVTATSAVLLIRVDHDGATAVQVGGWQPPIGITLVADRLAAIMLVVAVLMLLAVLLFAIGQPGAERHHAGFHPVYLVLAAGIALAFLTGDLFNLFVAFEVTLMASYVLITLGGRPDQIRSGMTYVVISLIASTLFLIALALVYAATGTVNLADLSTKVADLPDGVRSGLAVLLIVVFGIKAAIFPLFFWLPDSYPTAPTPVTAVFAGLLTKVGVYAIIRSQTLLFPADTQPGNLLLIVAGLTMVVGVFGAITQDDIKRILSFHIVSQIGYMIMGLGLFTLAGLAGAVLYIIHHIVVKTTLFLVAGLVEERAGTGKLAKLTGLARLEPVLAVLFLLPALSLAGIPPFSGFVAKLALVDAGVTAHEYLIVAVSLAVSLLTLFSMTKIWANAFWGGVDAGRPIPPAATLGGRSLMVGSTAALVALSLAIAVSAGPLYDLSERTAHDLIEPSAYIDTVLGR
ncbi:MAG TPA: Na+/H+ antiporter subunit D [Acidimicrobiales bacterium]|nr:Na+/H+ antiporter subunit D [Acidimicrobiales bacterium]